MLSFSSSSSSNIKKTTQPQILMMMEKREICEDSHHLFFTNKKKVVDIFFQKKNIIPHILLPLLRLFILLKGYHIFTDILTKNSLDFLFENFFSVHYNSIDIMINSFEEYKISREYGNDPSIRTFFFICISYCHTISLV